MSGAYASISRRAYTSAPPELLGSAPRRQNLRERPRKSQNVRHVRARDRPPEGFGSALDLEPDADRHLELGDLAVLDESALLDHLEPVHVAHRLRGLLDARLDRLREADGGRADELDLLVGAGHALASRWMDPSALTRTRMTMSEECGRHPPGERPLRAVTAVARRPRAADRAALPPGVPGAPPPRRRRRRARARRSPPPMRWREQARRAAVGRAAAGAPARAPRGRARPRAAGGARTPAGAGSVPRRRGRARRRGCERPRRRRRAPGDRALPPSHPTWARSRRRARAPRDIEPRPTPARRGATRLPPAAAAPARAARAARPRATPRAPRARAPRRRAPAPGRRAPRDRRARAPPPAPRPRRRPGRGRAPPARRRGAATPTGRRARARPPRGAQPPPARGARRSARRPRSQPRRRARRARRRAPRSARARGRGPTPGPGAPCRAYVTAARAARASPALQAREVGVPAHDLLEEVGQLHALLRPDDAFLHLLVERVLHAPRQVVGRVLHAREHLLDAIARDDLLDVEVLRVLVVHEHVDLVHAPEQVVHVAHHVLVRAGEEEPEEVGLARPERMERERLVHPLALDEPVDLAVGVAGDVDDGAVARGRLVQPVQGHDGEELIERPVVGRALEQREVRHVLVGDLVPQVARVAGQPLLAAVQRDEAAAELPEEALHDRALVEAEDAQLEHLQGLLLLRHRVVVGLRLVAPVERGDDLAHLANDLRLVRARHRGGGDLLRRADLDAAEDVHDHARVVRGDRPARLRDDVGLGDALVAADALQVVDDVADVLLERVVDGRALAVVVRPDVVDPEAAAHVEVLDGQAHLAELGVDARALVDGVLDDADVGELRADVEVEQLRAVLLPRLLQDADGVDELGDGEAELRRS